jgi:hypothetical protein
MRELLKPHVGRRMNFRGVFQKTGTKHGWKGRIDTTVLLTDICDPEGHEICDHIWLNETKQFKSLNLRAGDVVEFTARVDSYVKGYRGRRFDDDGWMGYAEESRPVERDYRLVFPTHVRRCLQHVKQPTLF